MHSGARRRSFVLSGAANVARFNGHFSVPPRLGNQFEADHLLPMRPSHVLPEREIEDMAVGKHKLTNKVNQLLKQRK